MDLRHIKEWADRMERRVSELEAKGQISEQRIDEHSDEIGRLDTALGNVEQRVEGNSSELRLHVKTLDSHSERITALEGYHVQPPTSPVDLTKYEEIFDGLRVKYLTQWNAITDVGHDYARHVVDGFHWMYAATGGDWFRAMAAAYANRVLDAVLARDRNLDDLRLVSGFRMLGDEEIDLRVKDVARRSADIVMSTGQRFDDWAVDQHELDFSWNPPQGEWQGVVGYYARCWHNPDSSGVDAFRECVERDVPGVWGAGWEERYRPARSSFKAGRDVRLLEIDESLRPIFEACAERIGLVPGALGVTQFVDRRWADDGNAVGVPLFDGWNYIVSPDLMDRVLDDVMAGRSTLMADVNTHPTGVRQLALCGATALRRARG